MKRKLVTLAIIGVVSLGLIQQLQFNPIKETKQQAKYLIYKVQPGDSLYSIAERFKPRYEPINDFVSILQYENNKRDGIYPGEELRVPVYSE